MKITSLIVILLFSSLMLFAQQPLQNSNGFGNPITNSGIGLGTIIAVVISWSQNKSILWVIIHGMFGWLYVIYYYLTRP
jgi:hypothetical protein